jgi:hypothetical protein
VIRAITRHLIRSGDRRSRPAVVHCDVAWEVLGVQGWNAPGVAKIVKVEGNEGTGRAITKGLLDTGWSYEPCGSDDLNSRLLEIFAAGLARRSWPTAVG